MTTYAKSLKKISTLLAAVIKSLDGVQYPIFFFDGEDRQTGFVHDDPLVAHMLLRKIAPACDINDDDAMRARVTRLCAVLAYWQVR